MRTGAAPGCARLLRGLGACGCSLNACGVDASAHLGVPRLAQEGLAHFEEAKVCQGQRHVRPALELWGTAEKPTWLHTPGEGVWDGRE